MDGLVSGMILDGTEHVTELAERLATTFRRPGHCAIAIANETKHTMLAPQRYINAGKINTLPMKIESGKTGLISAVKTTASPYGTAGVITYELETMDISDLPPYIRFQLMWCAPFYTNINDCKVNLAVNNMTANVDLWEKMWRGNYGELIRAKNTVHQFELGRNFKAMVYMGASGPTPLAITLTRNKD